MPPRMTTPSAGRPDAESRGGGTGERVGRGGGRGRRPREGNDERVNDLNGQGNDQEIKAVSKNVQENVRNVLVNGNRVGCSYKEFLACNPKKYDGKGGAVVLTRWIEKMENVQDMSGCSIDQKVKYTVGSFVGKALTWWNSHIRKLSREVTVSMLWNDFKFMMIEEFCPSHEMQKLKTELWNHAMVGASHDAYTDRFHELARLVPHLVTPESRKIEMYVYGLAPQIRRIIAATEPKTMQKAVRISVALTDEAVRNGSIMKVEKRGNVGEPSKDKNGRDDNKRTRTGNVFATTDCRSVPRNVNPVNARNSPVKTCYKCGSTDNVRPTCPRLNKAQGPEGNRPNQVSAKNVGQGRGNQGNQARGRAFMLGAEEASQDPNIVTGIQPNDLGFRYEIEIASGQLVEIDKVIKGCKLEIKVHVFDIDLIPFGHGSFDVIIVRDFSEVFPDDLSGLPPIQEIKFQIELIPGVVSVAKSPYRLEPSELEVLSGQIKELRDKGPSKIEAVKNWKALKTPTDVLSFLGLAGYYRRLLSASRAANALATPWSISALSWTFVTGVVVVVVPGDALVVLLVGAIFFKL
nr:zinc finger, CCHC-type, retrotransposon Gag domain protein [Tanacetum cinerariifolium]